MSHNITTRRFQITNTNSGHIFGIYEGTDASEALDAYAKDAGYTDFDAACEASGTDPDHIETQEIVEPSEAELVAEAIKNAGGLDDLKRALERFYNLGRDERAEAEMHFRWDALPTFGEEDIDESQIDGVFSWDRTRIFLLDGSHIEIRDRKLTNTVNGTEVVAYVGNLRNNTVAPAIVAALGDNNNSPDHNDPAIMARVAALAQKLGLKMTGGDPRFFHMSEGEQVFMDDNDGLLILTSGEWVAWEALDKYTDDDLDADDNNA